MHVMIVGPGNMGRALTIRFVAGAHSVALVGRDLRQAEDVASELRESTEGGGTIEGADLEAGIGKSDVVVLALPYAIALETAREHGHLLGGRVVVDITNPLNETYTGLATDDGPSAAERIRSLLPPGARVVKAFNTAFARTLVAGEVAGQPLDIFVAGDDTSANETVAELIRDGGMRPIVVGGLQRARELEALGFLSIAMQEPLGTGFMTGWKVLFPGTEAPESARFPRNAVVGVLPDTKPVAQIVTELAAIGVESSDVHLLMGTEGAAVLRNARRGSIGILGSLFGFEAEHTRRHLREVEEGRVVIVVGVEDDDVGERAGQVLARHGAHFVNYYSRWTARNLVP